MDRAVAYHATTATTMRQAVEAAVAAAANLTGANLAGAYLTGAYLTGANLADADLANANLVQTTGAPYMLWLGPIDGWTVTLTCEQGGWRIRAGCRYFTEAEAREWWGVRGGEAREPEHGARMMAAVETLLALARAAGWPEQAVTP